MKLPQKTCRDFLIGKSYFSFLIRKKNLFQNKNCNILFSTKHVNNIGKQHFSFFDFFEKRRCKFLSLRFVMSMYTFGLKMRTKNVVLILNLIPSYSFVLAYSHSFYPISGIFLRQVKTKFRETSSRFIILAYLNPNEQKVQL